MLRRIIQNNGAARQILVRHFEANLALAEVNLGWSLAEVRAYDIRRKLSLCQSRNRDHHEYEEACKANGESNHGDLLEIFRVRSAGRITESPGAIRKEE